jgi:hypothetical protein
VKIPRTNNEWNDLMKESTGVEEIHDRIKEAWLLLTPLETQVLSSNATNQKPKHPRFF